MLTLILQFLLLEGFLFSFVDVCIHTFILHMIGATYLSHYVFCSLVTLVDSNILSILSILILLFTMCSA